jgi:hypothetical protein
LLNTLGPAALSMPERMVLQALFRASTGDAARVNSLLDGVVVKNLLPEEQKLIETARTELARIDHAEGMRRQLTVQQEANRVSGKQGWLQLLPADSTDRENSQLQASDTFFAAGDLKGLDQLLHSGEWTGREHLRLALLTYLARAKDDIGSARTNWRAALAAAGSDLRRVDALIALASAWKWRDERLEALDRHFSRDASDPQALVELLDFHRAAGRTADMVRELDAYVSTQSPTPAQLSEFAYYSMLCNLNLARAYVTAQKLYSDSPKSSQMRAVYAFALWKQQRFDEAWQMIEELGPDASSVVPVPLLQAAVLADLKRGPDASQRLKSFQGENALPEEQSLAASLRRRLAEQDGKALSSS